MIKIKQLKRPRIRPYAFQVNRLGLAWGAKSNDIEILQIVQWVIFNLGTIEENRWEFRGFGPSYLNIYFTSEEDAVSFKLRWVKWLQYIMETFRGLEQLTP